MKCFTPIANIDRRGHWPVWFLMVWLSACATRAESLDIRGAEIEYSRTGGVLTVRGDAQVRRDTDVLMADRIRVNTTAEVAEAEGQVRLMRGASLWTGARMRYDFRTRRGDFADVESYEPPWRLRAADIAVESTNRIVLRHACVSTCTNAWPHWHYRIRASELRMRPGDHFTASHGLFYLGSVPSLYLPWVYWSLDPERGFHYRPGRSSAWGLYLLTSYRYRFTPQLLGATEVDVRQDRGVALGQRIRWRSAVGATDPWQGDVHAYYADDRDADSVYRETSGDDADTDRYRLRLRHRHRFGDYDDFSARAQYLSDPYLLEDFFEDEYETESQPYNHAAWSHNRADWTAGLLTQFRINDFFATVERLPEVSFDAMARELGWGFYYESASDLAYLRRRWPAADTRADYDAWRLDSRHQVSRPMEWFGFLNVVPRAAYRATVYDATPLTVTEIRIVPPVTPGAPEETQTVTRVVEDDGVLRSVYEVGAEVSYKLFRVFNPGATALRHVVEPYAGWTWIPEPDQTSAQLYAFDDVERIGKTHVTRLGFRQRLQSKRRGAADLLYADLHTDLQMEPENDEPYLDLVRLDIRAFPSRNLIVRGDGAYSVDAGTLDAWNTRLVWLQSRWFNFDLEHRYRVDRSSVLNAELALFPERAWSLNMETRYDFESETFYEYAGSLQRNLDCMVIRLGGGMRPAVTRADGTERPDDWKVTFDLSIRALDWERARAREADRL